MTTLDLRSDDRFTLVVNGTAIEVLITFVDAEFGRVGIGVEAPRSIRVDREEVRAARRRAADRNRRIAEAFRSRPR